MAPVDAHVVDGTSNRVFGCKRQREFKEGRELYRRHIARSFHEFAMTNPAAALDGPDRNVVRRIGKYGRGSFAAEKPTKIRIRLCIATCKTVATQPPYVTVAADGTLRD